MITTVPKSYDPREFQALTFHDAVAHFALKCRPNSMLFAPAVTMPLLAVGGLPVGVQLMGQQHEDARVMAIARWMLDAIAPVCVSA